MKRVYKYVLPEVVNTIQAHRGARFIHAAEQYQQITVWAEVDPSEPVVDVTLEVVGTGCSIPEPATHIGSLLTSGGAFVFHVYAHTT